MNLCSVCSSRWMWGLGLVDTFVSQERRWCRFECSFGSVFLAHNSLLNTSRRSRGRCLISCYWRSAAKAIKMQLLLKRSNSTEELQHYTLYIINHGSGAENTYFNYLDYTHMYFYFYSTLSSDSIGDNLTTNCLITFANCSTAHCGPKTFHRLTVKVVPAEAI